MPGRPWAPWLLCPILLHLRNPSILGTAQVSLLLTAAESKGNVKTISTPRITAQNNQTANIVNGLQIPVQTQSNNTVTVTYVTAALKLEITPQITDAGTVVLRVIAENN